jgi:alkane 1-monooxygenase
MSPWVYLSAHLSAIFGFMGFFVGGAWSFAYPLFTFALIPIIELFLSPRTANQDEEDLQALAESRFYHWQLIAIVPIQYGLLVAYLWGTVYGEWSIIESIGCTLTMGVACGTFGINVAHELGHQSDSLSKWSAKALLLTSLYMHFFIEHNRGHHVRVATEEDPASARLNETVYAFWWRSVVGSFYSAWHIEERRLSRRSISSWSWSNQALRFVVIEAVMIMTIALVGGLIALLGFLAVAIIGFSLLEIVNYIEHYGLQRQRNARGRYKPVTPAHSWNADYPLSRMVLFELSRHSDHHAHPRRAYQQLRHFPESFQLPTGYPGMILLALIPPLYIPFMARCIERETQRVRQPLGADSVQHA